ncbi:MAG: hypothetical protein JSV00_03980, partial [bacterium]
MVSGKAFIDALTSRGRRGLRWEILVSLGLIMLSGVLFMGATALKAAEKTILVQKLESLTQVTRSLQMGLAGWWGIGEPPGEIQALMGPTAAALGINGFKVTDTEGRLLASLRTQEMGTVTADPFLLKALATGSLVVPGEVAGKAPETPRGSWTFAAPVFRDGILIGAFSVSYPLENLDVVLRLHRKIVFTFALLDGIFIVLFGGWLIGR